MSAKGYILVKWLLPVVYLLIFLPQLSNKIAPNNHNLIITLTTVENWEKDGIFEHNFNLVHSWGNPGDKNVHYYKRVMNEDGRNYFVSYPPLSFILVYPFLQLFPKDYYPIGFKLFGIIVHLLTYLVLLYLFRRKSKFQRLFGAAVFLFFPASIVLSGMYYPEQLILLFLICFAIEIKEYKRWPVLVGLSMLMVYTDWLGSLTVGVVILLTIVKKLEFSLKPIIIGAVLGCVILVFQYSLIDGIDGLIHGLKIRYLERAGLFPSEYSDRGVNLFSGNSIQYFIDHVLVTVGFTAMLLFVLRSKLSALNEYNYIVMLPVLLHMMLLFNSNVLHFQNLSKLGIVFAILASNVQIDHYLKWAVVLTPIYSFIVCTKYWDKYAPMDEIYGHADKIKALNDPNKVMVINQVEFQENLVLLSYLTKRNLVWASSENEIQSLLRETNQKGYIWVDLSN